jgi:glycosyltransferase involved in cell wall biosynthesis
MSGSEPPLRVLQAGSTAFPGGVTNAIKTLCRTLKQLGHEVTLFADGGDLRDLESDGIACHVSEFRYGPGSVLGGSWRLRKILGSFRPDVVHVHGRAPALRSLLAGRSADWFTLHSTQLTDQVGFYDKGFIRRYLSPMGKNFFVLDGAAAEYLQTRFGIDAGAIVRIQNGVDCQRFRPPTEPERAAARERFGLRLQETFVVFLGRLHPGKQPNAVVAAAARARQEGRSSLRFALIGEGELRDSVVADIERLGVGATCALHPWMDPMTAYHAADLVVMPSLYEGYGLVGAEAISTGCPVLRSKTGGSEVQIREGVSGFECAPDAQSFIDRLFQVVEQPERLAAMRATARDHALARLDVMEATRQVAAAYRERLRKQTV